MGVILINCVKTLHNYSHLPVEKTKKQPAKTIRNGVFRFVVTSRFCKSICLWIKINK